jgi:cytoskeletal protein CcmA (bactofilin family)
MDPQPPAQPQFTLPSWHPDEDLMPLEEEVKAKAAAGEPVDSGVGPFNLAQMQAWGEERAVRAEVLRYLLTGGEWPVGAKGVRLRGVRVVGYLDLDAATLRCPLALDCCYLDAGEPVCLDHATVSLLSLTRCHLAGLTGLRLSAGHVDLSGSILAGPLLVVGMDIAGQLLCRGVQLTGRDSGGYALAADVMKVAGDVLLDGMVASGGAVRLAGADITGQLSCVGAQLSGRSGDGHALVADGMKVGRNVFLNGVSASAGAVRVPGAAIAGQLNCQGAKLTGHDNERNALQAEVMKVGGHVLLNEGFAAAGAVRLVGAEITGQLNCRDALLTGRDGDGNALMAQGVKVGGPVLLEGASASAGAVRVSGADISGSLISNGAQFTGLDAFGNALVADGMQVGGDVFLAEEFTAGGAVWLEGADITGTLRCRKAKLTGCNKDGYALYARGIKVGGDAYLDEGFTACGAVRLTRADIAGTLSCKGAKLAGNEQDRYALYARGMRVGGDVALDEGFTADGAVRLTRADITGAVSCSGAQLTGADENGDCLIADGIKVGGDVLLDKRFTASGPVRLLGADIAKRLDCRTSVLTGCDENHNALHGERIKVGGDMWFDDAFIACGAVCLLSADITGQLSCAGARLTGRDIYGNALHGEGIKVGGDMCLDAGFIACGTISLASAHAGTLRWAPAAQILAQVNLEGASVGELRDDWTSKRPTGYWPADGKLRLDGFTYSRFGGDHQADVKQRLAWIRSQYKPKLKPTVRRSETFAAPVITPTSESTENFATQPYEQLAAVYRQAGQDSQARKVAIARRADLRKYGNLNWYRRFGNWFLDTTIRYGYQTWRAAAALAILFGIFVWLSALAQQNHLIMPVGNTEGLHLVPSATRCTSSYPCFNPVGYAVDTVIPLINVHQADNWGPDGSTPRGEAFMFATWIWTALGWALATLLVAGYTGLVRQE